MRRAARRLHRPADGGERQPDDAGRSLRHVPPGRRPARSRRAAETLVAQFEATAAEIARRQAARGSSAADDRAPRVLLLEWLDPPFCSGHWNPEIIELAGGVEPRPRRREVATDHLGRSGREPSRCDHRLAVRLRAGSRAQSELDALAIVPSGATWRPSQRGASPSSTARRISPGPAPGSRPACESPPPPSTRSAAATWLRRKAWLACWPYSRDKPHAINVSPETPTRIEDRASERIRSPGQ